MVSMTSSVDVKDPIPSIQRIESESSTTLPVAPVKKSSSFNKTKSFVSSVVSQVGFVTIQRAKFRNHKRFGEKPCQKACLFFGIVGDR